MHNNNKNNIILLPTSFQKRRTVLRFDFGEPIGGVPIPGGGGGGVTPGGGGGGTPPIMGGGGGMPPIEGGGGGIPPIVGGAGIPKGGGGGGIPEEGDLSGFRQSFSSKEEIPEKSNPSMYNSSCNTK